MVEYPGIWKITTGASLVALLLPLTVIGDISQGAEREEVTAADEDFMEL